MRSYIPLVALVHLFICCSRKPTTVKPANTVKTDPHSVVADSSLRDFKFFPLNNAKWVVRFRGTWYNDSTGSHYDSSFYSVTTVRTTGNIILHNSKYYMVYKTKTVQYTDRSPTSSADTGFLYVREDTADQKAYCWMQIMNLTIPNERLLVDFSLHTGDAAMVTNFLQGAITKVDSFPIHGQYCRRWAETDQWNTNTFYQAYGIGWRLGILPWGTYNSNSPTVVSVDFMYRSDSIHLDFTDLH